MLVQCAASGIRREEICPQQHPMSADDSEMDVHGSVAARK
jgi:hypothetical protein